MDEFDLIPIFSRPKPRFADVLISQYYESVREAKAHFSTDPEKLGPRTLELVLNQLRSLKHLLESHGAKFVKVTI